MAKVFSNPIEPPAFLDSDGEFDHLAYESRCEAYRKETEDYIRKHLGGKGKHCGKIIRFQVADGYAQYMVWTLTKLIHLDEVDGYHADPALIRGLRAADVRDKIEQQERLSALFSAS